MLLNTDLHGQNIGRKMTCSEFIDNLSELNDGDNFPKDILKHLYHAIKVRAIEWASDDDPVPSSREEKQKSQSRHSSDGGISNPFLDTSDMSAAIEYKKGYVMRKCCFESSNKKSVSTLSIIHFLKSLNEKFLYSAFWKAVLENVLLYSSGLSTVLT